LTPQIFGKDIFWYTGQLILSKIIKTAVTSCQILKLKCTAFDFRWGSAPDPAGGACSAPQTPQLDLRGPLRNVALVILTSSVKNSSSAPVHKNYFGHQEPILALLLGRYLFKNLRLHRFNWKRREI